MRQLFKYLSPGTVFQFAVLSSTNFGLKIAAQGKMLNLTTYVVGTMLPDTEVTPLGKVSYTPDPSYAVENA